MRPLLLTLITNHKLGQIDDKLYEEFKEPKNIKEQIPNNEIGNKLLFFIIIRSLLL